MVIQRNEDRQGRRRGEKRSPKITKRMLIIGSLIVFAIGIIFAMLLSLTGSNVNIGPNVGEHIHAKYAVRVCGEKIKDFPYSAGDVHTHGDGLIHIHPNHVREAGSNANIARFMAGTGSKITDQYLTLPTGEKYENGQSCPDGQIGKLLLKVNGVEQKIIASYVPIDGDEIEILFLKSEYQIQE